MAEYIEREAAIQAICDNPCRLAVDAVKAVAAIKRVTAADVVEVRHGKWVRPSPHSQERCNQCGATARMVFGILPNYCPNCGAKMDGKGESE